MSRMRLLASTTVCILVVAAADVTTERCAFAYTCTDATANYECPSAQDCCGGVCKGENLCCIFNSKYYQCASATKICCAGSCYDKTQKQCCTDTPDAPATEYVCGSTEGCCQGKCLDKSKDQCYWDDDPAYVCPVSDKCNSGTCQGTGGAGGTGGTGGTGGAGGTGGCNSRGDPHVLTLDGLVYDFQGAGEFFTLLGRSHSRSGASDSGRKVAGVGADCGGRLDQFRPSRHILDLPLR